jgi:hypothetical protein
MDHLNQQHMLLLKRLDRPHGQINLELDLGQIRSHRGDPLVVGDHLLRKLGDRLQQGLLRICHLHPQIACLWTGLVRTHRTACSSKSILLGNRFTAVTRVPLPSPGCYGSTDRLRAAAGSLNLIPSSEIQAVPGRPKPGRAWAFLNGLWASTNKSRVVPCPPNGLVARPRHNTSPVNWAMPAHHDGSCRPTCPTRK